MFTGLIEAVGKVASIESQGGDKSFVIDCPAGFLSDVSLGDSIAVSGVCLTATQITGNRFRADVSNETLSLTSLGNLQSAHPVNLEKAMQAGARLGGHIVSGHVDGLGEILHFADDGRSQRIDIALPQAIAHYVAKKGSITVDGISLTVNDVTDKQFSVNIVPHTSEKTTLSAASVGQAVNLEVDMLARYLERLLQKTEDTSGPSDDTMRAMLSENGYMKS